MRHAIGAIFSAMILAAGCASNGLAPVGQARRPAPDFSLLTLNGQPIALVNLRGKIAVLDFWATWCASCVQGLGRLQAIAANADLARDGVVVLAVNEGETPQTIRPFIDEKHFTFTVARDSDGSVARAYCVFALPTTFIVGRDGLVQAVFSGWTQDTAEQIDEALEHSRVKNGS